MYEDLDISELANFAIKIADKNYPNYKCAEIFVGKSEYLNIEVEENSVKYSEIGRNHGISIRIYQTNGSLGFAFTNKMNKKVVEKIVKNAIKMMRVGTPDPNFKNLPGKLKKYTKVEDLYDKSIESLSIEDAIENVKDLIKVCTEDDQAISQSGDFTANSNLSYIFNSNGIEVSGEETLFNISSNMIVKDAINGEASNGYESQMKRKLINIEGTKAAEEALKNAKNNLHRKKIKTKKMPVILSPKGTINLILNPIASAINAEMYQYKRSFLVGKLGKKIGSDSMNIDDNATINGRVGSNIFDGEGFPCKNKKIIENGQFLQSGLLHNSYTAGKEGVESTGNASRSSFSSIPSIGISNLIFQPGTAQKDELIKNVKEGILLNSTADSPNIATGDFSGLISQGNLIQNGEIKHALNETMFGINLLELYENITSISKEYKIYGPFSAPYVKIDNVQIIGAQSLKN
ncbi:MAG: TldD/PmbA family protein [Candidatus Lokiarchaeota archaeon]|nr:TldD/PmbA family protein [Candidatus Lokiarchaeota archaeon]